MQFHYFITYQHINTSSKPIPFNRRVQYLQTQSDKIGINIFFNLRLVASIISLLLLLVRTVKISSPMIFLYHWSKYQLSPTK